MKIFCLTFLLIIWFLLTVILATSIIGWILLIPQNNDTRYYKSQSELRSTWMRIGYSLKDALIDNN